MAEEDIDYMADLTRFIPSEFAVPPPVKNKKSSTDGDKANWKGKKKLKFKQQKTTEEDLLKEGLGAAIPSTNLGFKMLQQMGYTPGAALGKHGQGVLEPVNVDLKRGRTGIGRDVAVREGELLKVKQAELEVVRQRQAGKELRADFQERRKSSWQTRRIAGHYAKALATLAELEERLKNSSYSKTESLSKDRAEIGGEKSDGEEVEEEITLEMFQEVLEKLKTGFNYCFFCGVQYESSETLAACCPGLHEEDH